MPLSRLDCPLSLKTPNMGNVGQHGNEYTADHPTSRLRRAIRSPILRVFCTRTYRTYRRVSDRNHGSPELARRYRRPTIQGRVQHPPIGALGRRLLRRQRHRSHGASPRVQHDLLLQSQGARGRIALYHRLRRCVDGERLGNDQCLHDDSKQSACTDRTPHGVSVHEAVHVLGVTRVDNAGGYHDSHPFYETSPITAMSWQFGLRCSPHPFDVMAIYALYQSW